MPVAREQRPTNGTVPTVGEALERVVDAAQHLASDQVSLAKLEVTSTLEHAAAGGMFLLGGAVMVLVAWSALMMAAYQALLHTLAPVPSLLVVAVGNLAVGGWLAWHGQRLLHPAGASDGAA